MTPSVSIVNWKPSWRIIPSRFPPIDLFERTTDASELEAVMAVEAMTNPRVRDEVGDIRMVAPEDRIAGPGTSVIMAAFTHLNPSGSRFSDGSFGVFYTAHELETAVAETKYHREIFMRATREKAMDLDMRVYQVDLAGQLHDLRGLADQYPEIYDLKSYAASQALGHKLRTEGSCGVVYDSVRQEKGTCAGVFRPRVLSNVRQERHLSYRWDGTRISTIYEKRDVHL